MNISIGYVQLLGDMDRVGERVRQLREMGAHVVRVEDSLESGGLLKPRLNAICDFIGPGDELITPELAHLGESADAVLDVIRRLHQRGAHLRLLDPDMSTADETGRAVIQALIGIGPAPAPRAPKASREVDARTIMALRAHGFGPSQIAKKLGVSRMTVWRKLAGEQEGRPEPAARTLVKADKDG